MKVFLDTNVLVAACLQDHEHHSRALPLVQTIHEKRVQGYTSAHSLLEFYSVLTRLPRSPRLSTLQAASLIEENFLNCFIVVTLTTREYGMLILRLGRDGISGGQVYDALHLACALKVGVDRIYTFNVRHFQRMAGDDLHSRIVSP